tara:strand:+ start:1102 stop:2313 length:1212 start_codon:yes stop_codon:yes gene_type:complete
MKLFQKLLLAPAALGLFAPVVANANESNFRAVTNYTQDTVEVSLDTFKPLSSKNPLLAGGEGASSSQSNNDFSADSFSATTLAQFTSNFALATIDGESAAGANLDQEMAMNFDWEVALSTSFTGNDSLDVVMNAGVSALFPELDMTNSAGAQVMIDTVTYTNALSDRVTAFFATGNGTSGSTLFNTACVYGGVATTFGDCGVSAANVDEGLGSAVGASFAFDNGLSFALGYEGQGLASGEVGLLSTNGADAFGAQVSYYGDSYGVSVSFANIDNHSNANVRSAGQTQSTGVNAFYAPDLNNFPAVSVGFESNHDNNVTTTHNDETSHYFVGLQWDEVGDGTLGAAIGSKEPTAENTDAQTMYEVFYTYNYADGITLTPFYYNKDNTGTTESETGIGVKTEFSF